MLYVVSFQNVLNSSIGFVSTTKSLEKLLKTICDGLEFYIQTKLALGYSESVPLTRMSSQCKESIEILAASGTLSILENTLSLFSQTVDWKKGTSRCFLLFYTLLTDLKLVDKWGFISLKRINKISFGNLSLFEMVRKSFYALYCFFIALEAWTKGKHLKTALYACRIFAIIIDNVSKATQTRNKKHSLLIAGLCLTADGLSWLT